MRGKGAEAASALEGDPPEGWQSELLYANLFPLLERDPNMGSTARYKSPLDIQPADISTFIADSLQPQKLAPLLQAIDEATCSDDMTQSDMARSFYPQQVFTSNHHHFNNNNNDQMYLTNTMSNTMSAIAASMPMLDPNAEMQLIYSTEEILDSVDGAVKVNLNVDTVIKDEKPHVEYDINNALANDKCVMDCLNIESCHPENDLSQSETLHNREQHIESDISIICIPDESVPSRARASLPVAHLMLGNNKDNESSVVGVFARQQIPMRARFGPLEGVQHPYIDSGDRHSIDLNHPRFLLQLKDQKYYIDVSDEKTSNWMRYVRFSPDADQNVSLQQSGDKLYFTSIKSIPPRSELVLGYSASYANYWGLHAIQSSENESIEWSCYECSLQFNTSIELNIHLNTQHDVENELHFKKSLKRNFEIANNMNNNCETCDSSFPRSFGLKRQMKTHIPIDIHNTENSISSNGSLDDDKVKNEPDKSNEMECDYDDIKMDVDGIVIAEKECTNLSASMDNATDINMSDVVNFQPLNTVADNDIIKVQPKSAENHSADFENKLNTADIAKISCCLCPENFQLLPDLAKHIKSEHTLDDGVYMCSNCDKKFPDYDAIENHIKMQCDSKEYSCKKCTVTFETNKKLQLHSLKHLTDAVFSCPNCNKSFKRKDKLKEHMKRQRRVINNNKEVIYLCGERSHGSLSNGHSDNSYLLFTFKCHPCRLGFKRRGMLVNHLARHHPDVSRASVPELQLPIMRKAREYFCQHCDKVYKSSSKRKAHILKNHPGESLPPSSRDLAGSESNEIEVLGYSTCVGTISSVPHSCPYTPCHKQYASKAKLSQHIRHKHLSNKTKENEEIIDNNKPQAINIFEENVMAIDSEIVENASILTTESELSPDNNTCDIVTMQTEGSFDDANKSIRPMPSLHKIPHNKFTHDEKCNRDPEENVAVVPDPSNDAMPQTKELYLDGARQTVKLDQSPPESKGIVQNDEIFFNCDKSLLDDYLCYGSNYLPLMVFLANDMKILEKNDDDDDENVEGVQHIIDDGPSQKVHISGHILSVGTNKPSPINILSTKNQYFENALGSQYTDR